MAKRTKKASTATGKSPYKKYQKRPVQYSPQYYAWKSAVMAGKGVEAASASHSQFIIRDQGPMPGGRRMLYKVASVQHDPLPGALHDEYYYDCA